MPEYLFLALLTIGGVSLYMGLGVFLLILWFGIIGKFIREEK